MRATARTALFLLTSFITSITCQAAPKPQDIDANALWLRMEQGLMAVDAEGQDNGPQQSIEERMAALNVPGLSIALFDAGEIVWARGYGVKDQEAATPVEATTLFQAASISKPVTSAGLFRMVERGELTLDEDVNKRLKSWQLPENEFTTTEKVTPRRIVTHIGGLSVHGFRGYATGESVPTVPQILDGVPPANSSPVRVFEVPGIRETYSGGGFTILQLLMQDVSGRPFDALMDGLVLQPAGMTHSTFAQPLPSALTNQAATGHLEDGSAVAGQFHTYPERAAAGLWTTPSDLARFMLAVGRSYREEPHGLLEPSSAKAMLTQIPGAGGQGFGLSGEGDAFRYRHSGRNQGFTCYAVAFANSGRGVVLMTNSDNGNQLMREVTRAISREYGWPSLWIRD